MKNLTEKKKNKEKEILEESLIVKKVNYLLYKKKTN